MNPRAFIFLVTLVAAACGGASTPDETSSQHRDALSVACIQKLNLDPQSPTFALDLQKCIDDIRRQAEDEARAALEAGLPPATSLDAGAAPPFPSFDAALPPLPSFDGGSVCQTGFQCVNGSCMCTTGPLQGTSCTPQTCPIVCNVCK